MATAPRSAEFATTSVLDTTISLNEKFAAVSHDEDHLDDNVTVFQSDEGRAGEMKALEEISPAGAPEDGLNGDKAHYLSGKKLFFVFTGMLLSLSISESL
jgi:hypothetical protein